MTTNFKIIFTLVSMLVFQTAFGQLKLGTYKIISDTISYFEGHLFSRLIFKPKNRFTYKYLTSVSCYLWYDSNGKWATNNDTLTLIDNVISYHPVINFNKYKKTDDNEVLITIKTKNNQPIQGIKILYIFKNSKDTLFGTTNSQGKFIIDTKDRIAIKKEGKYRSVDDLVIWVVYFNKKKGKDQTTNTFSDLSADIECVIDDNAKNESVIRTTIYKIDKTNLIYLSQRFDKEDVRPGRYLFGNYRFDKQ